MKRYGTPPTEWDIGLVEMADGPWVSYVEAEKLQMRITELEQKLKTPDELKAEFEKECG